MPEHTQEQLRHTITPGITVKDGVRAIDFYKKAFGAEELMRMPGPDGQGIMHAELKIGDSIFYLADEFPEMGQRSPETLGGASGDLFLSVPDVDAAFRQAIEAGAKEEMEVEDMFWGDRMGSVIDPFGHHWAISTHKEDVEPDELHRRAQEFFAKMGECKGKEAKASV